MLKKTFSLKSILYKTFVFMIIFYALIIVASLSTTTYLFLNLPNYKSRIENFIFENTGYKFTIKNIDTGLSNNYLPRLTINNASLTNPLNPKEQFGVKKFELVLSPSSIWHLSVIFDQINISGTDLIFEHKKDGTFTINGLEISQKEKHNNKKKTIDLEGIFLKQKTIHLSHINLSYTDHQVNIPKITLPDIDILFSNTFNNRHNLNMSIGNLNDINNQVMTLKFNWQGGKFSEIESWKSANVKLQTYRKSNNVVNKITKYLPGSDFFDDLNAQTAAEANLTNGKLQSLYANFDIQNIHYFLHKTQSEINFPRLTGIIDLKLIDNDTYSIKASNLSLSTIKGAIIANQQINGEYNIGADGELSVKNTDLSGINQLLTILPDTEKLTLSGNLDVVKFNWLGKISKPTDYTLAIKFTNIGLISKESAIPSINNISGDVLIHKESGAVNLNFKNTKMLYPKVFLIPYQFKNLSTNIEWYKNKESNLEVIINPTSLELTDFSGYAYGKYISNESNAGYLSLRAHINRLQTSKVGDYLPLNISMDVHKWLNKGLIGGNAESADLILEGWLNDFPFEKNPNGKFYIDANVVDGKLNYVDEWPPLEHINGKFRIRNESIIIETNDAYIHNNKIRKAYVIIPDMTAEKVNLIADGEASGSTDNFMQYLSKTPINEIIGKIPEKVDAKGEGYLTLHLDVPFYAPMKTKVDGTFKFIDNKIQFDMPVPYLTNVNGILHYSDHGIVIDKITAKTLNSDAVLQAKTEKNGSIKFIVQSDNLDYDTTLHEYLPFITPIINGRSPTTIKFDITKGALNLNATSTLSGVEVTATPPINKTKDSESYFNLSVAPNSKQGFDIKYNYANMIYGLTTFNNNGSMDQTLINIGGPTLPNKSLNTPKVLITLTQSDTALFDWFTTINNVLSQKESTTNVTPSTEQYTGKFHKEKSTAASIYPIEVLVDTPILYLGTRHLTNFMSDILVLNDQTVFNVNSTVSNGYGIYTYKTNTINVYLNEFNILEAVSDTANVESKVIESQPINSKLQAKTNTADNGRLTSKIPNIDLIIHNLYYENIRVAEFKTKILQSGDNIVIESGHIHSINTETTFSGMSYCATCKNNQAFVELLFNLQIYDLGQLLNTLGQEQYVARGNGNIVTKIQWDGKFQDFEFSHLIASINVNLQNGKLLKVSTGSIFGEILGLINLQSITNLMHLDFSDAFSNGFYFNVLKVKAYLLKNKLDIKSLYMAGPLAIVRSYGLVDLKTEEVNIYLIITPKLGAGIAIGAAIATVNPIVGIITYVAELVLGEPFSKLFTFSYHITGKVKDPKLTRVDISDQVLSNLNAAIGNTDEQLK